MTPRQKELARHALGLRDAARQSYRNHFVCGTTHRDHTEWCAMVDRGYARRWDGKDLHFGGDDLFKLTQAGAEAWLTVSLVLQLGASLTTALAIWRMGDKRISGPVWGLISQVFWFAWIFYDRHWGIAPVSILMTAIYIRNLIKWRREARA